MRIRALAASLFLVSGFPALLYQLVWQRALFDIFGVNVESVTVVVTAFMLGLGLGSLAGGRLSVSPRVSKLLAFGLIEAAIGLFGLVSLPIFALVASWTSSESLLVTGVLSFLLVVLPTLLMGATLPLLVAFLVERSRNVGRSVGLLYFVNTLGSAIACFVAAFWLLGAFGARGTVHLAAFTNLAVGASAVLLWALRHRRAPAPTEPPMEPRVASAAPTSGRFKLALVLSALAGFISLSYEIVWVRIFSIASAGNAAAFPVVLGCFLLGIALGSALARWISARNLTDTRLLQVLGVLILAGNACAYLLVPTVARALSYLTYWGCVQWIVPSGLLLGATFPLICHYGIPPDERVGARLGLVYLANILGATAGPLLTGFVLLDLLPLQSVCVFLSLLGVAMGAFALLWSRPRGVALGLALGAVVALSVLVVSTGPALFDRVYERLIWRFEFDGVPFASVVENRVGVIAVTDSGVVFGGGVYDGRFNTSLLPDRNLIRRAYVVGALHPHPRRVLMIGLSSGSWAQVLVHHPDVDELVVVEINPGYTELIAEQESVRSLLANPKLELVVDDGRRWLRNHDERFDLIVMNASFHWRAHASALLSRELLELARRHLADGGLMYYNTTDSTRAMRTGLEVFPYGLLYFNFLALSERPLTVDVDRLKALLTGYRIDGRPVLEPSNDAHSRALEELLGQARGELLRYGRRAPVLESGESVRHRVSGEVPITDDNMGEEWELHRAFTWAYLR